MLTKFKGQNRSKHIERNCSKNNCKMNTEPRINGNKHGTKRSMKSVSQNLAIVCNGTVYFNKEVLLHIHRENKKQKFLSLFVNYELLSKTVLIFMQKNIEHNSSLKYLASFFVVLLLFKN